MQHGRRKRPLALVAGAIVALCVFAPLVHAELTEQGDLFVRFRGGINPTALPRNRLAPVTISAGGTVKTLSGAKPPALRQIKIEVNRGGKLDTAGLPVCRYKQLIATSPQQALAACGGALVGDGDFEATLAFPEQESFSASGHILDFNSVYRGHRAVLAHVFGANPIPITRIVVFQIRHQPGTYGTVISGHLSPNLNHYGYLKTIVLRLHRRFFYRGRWHSYMSAACSAPMGFSSALFPFARASMRFADGRSLSSTLTRSCKVSG